MKKYLFLLVVSICFREQAWCAELPRIIVSTDIGGTDPDDNQSLIHLMMYSDRFNVEGLISSPFGKGRKKDILEMIDIYEKDFSTLRVHYPKLLSPTELRAISKQGEVESAPYFGFRASTEGSEWIIKCAKKKSDQPLWILVWGGLEDLAQALHDSPEIASKIRVFWIGGPNKKWSVNAYNFIASEYPNLWFIESNATYRGWFMEDENAPLAMHGKAFYNNFIKGRGAMAADFEKYYDGHIKMGDTPSLAFLLKGNPEEPEKESWGGQYRSISRSSRYIFTSNTSVLDSFPAYGVVEWRFKGANLSIPPDSVCFFLKIQNQEWPGFYLGEGTYAVRYSSKKPEVGSYTIHSPIKELDGQSGGYLSTTPWPGKPSKDDYLLGKHWYGDLEDTQLFLENQQGARTVSKFRKEYLQDWANRWKCLEK
jgi:hypothetical protein